LGAWIAMRFSRGLPQGSEKSRTGRLLCYDNDLRIGFGGFSLSAEVAAMSVTIKQIAERTGLSVPTVGNVLGRASMRYSEATRKKVFAAVEEMGYKPNSSARAMRQGRFGCAAMILSRSHLNFLSHIPAGLLDGVDEELSLHNMHLSVSRLSDDELSREDFGPKVLREYVADGLIVNYTHAIPPGMLEVINANRTPAVWVNAKLKADCVYPDDRAGARMATEAMIAQGHRRITFVHLIEPGFFGPTEFAKAKPRLHYSVADRMDGYSRAMKKAGLKPVIGYDDRFTCVRDMVKACVDLLSVPERPTAMIAYSQHETPAIVFAAAQLGLDISRDLAILQFSPTDDWVAGTRIPAMLVPTENVGRQAVRMLLRKIKTPSALCEPEAVAYAPLGSEQMAMLALPKG
jgi:DNA-binding LacI/PurR family transcriptional regulator